MTYLKRIAVVCLSNQNRSMEAHALLQKKGFDVYSYGTGTHVKLPGPSVDKPNIYKFGYTYDDIYNDLKTQNYELYKNNGLLNMLDRNRKTKAAPQSWYDEKGLQFDIIIAYEDRVFEQICEDIQNRMSGSNKPVHIICMDIKDNHDEALIGATLTLQLCQMVMRIS